MTTAGESVIGLGERVYRELREQVMSGQLPAHARLVEGRLCEALGVSRTPLREALVRLHSDGIVTRREDGYYPLFPDLDSIRDLYELRVTLELRGIARHLEKPANSELRIDRPLLEAVRRRWLDLQADPPEPSPDIVQLDQQFHVDLSTAAGNPALTRALTTVNSQIRLVRMYDYQTPERVDATVTEHLEIVERILDGELSGALAALHAHVGGSLDVVEQRAVRAITAHALHGRR
ncbi:GntR family transcriptional regulator [Prescottella equi]|uniref:FCD domain-containing protein n=1 Tax=Rhodococcus hoagii TaxID=43767 RepID=A0AAE5IPY8_RHOHA|nr:GntR family transcriptional regulator [Prescottella equi]AVP68027.1 GntR family transcriptional regulator [Prescottella equi]ERN46275.1 GntR family transcriptional regulator [Prescottella equi NBRC 101255 = C 7]MBM4625913.1 FCD domain-containing protein [Prescottella equi]MBM4628030.1 FCD domain-containing protein [Prescottella equi]NKS42465.1 FCD domain-containing protein [Prescottella equi]